MTTTKRPILQPRGKEQDLDQRVTKSGQHEDSHQNDEPQGGQAQGRRRNWDPGIDKEQHSFISRVTTPAIEGRPRISRQKTKDKYYNDATDEEKGTTWPRERQ